MDSLGKVWEETHDLAALGFNIELDRTYDFLQRQTELNTYLGGTADLKNSYSYDSYSRVTGLTQQGFGGGNAVAEKNVALAYNKLDQFTSLTRYADLSGMSTVATSTFAYDGMNANRDCTSTCDLRS